MGHISDIYKAINAVSNKVNDCMNRLNSYTDNRDDVNDANITDTQNAVCEQSTMIESAQADTENALIELDEMVAEQIAEIENALCELSEEGGQV